MVARGGVEPPTFRFSVGRSYQLSYLAAVPVGLATPTGLEPATSAVTGRRANQLRYGALLVLRAPNGIRTRAAALKGRSPRPLDDGDLGPATSAVEGHFMVPERCKSETAPIPLSREHRREHSVDP